MRENLSNAMEERRQTIFDETGSGCGELTSYVITKDDPDDLRVRIAKAVVPSGKIWPFLHVHLLEVNEKERGKGFGTAAMSRVVADGGRNGIKLFILRIGHFDGSTPTGRQHALRIAAWYERLGFKQVVTSGVQSALQEPSRTIKSPEMLWMYLIPEETEPSIP